MSMTDLAINPTLWIAFAAACALLAAIPGPIVTLVIANSLSHGTRAGLLNIVGTICGTTILLAIGGFGMTWVIVILSEWFEILRWAGAAYLVYLGVRQWFAKGHGLEEHPEARPGKSLFLQGFIVAITNPKTIIFYAALFPQFMDPALPTGQQVLILSITFIAVVPCVDVTYAILAGRMRPLLIGARRARIRNRITGVLLAGTGLALALTRKS